MIEVRLTKKSPSGVFFVEGQRLPSLAKLAHRHISLPYQRTLPMILTSSAVHS
jgi:hypothetical protein